TDRRRDGRPREEGAARRQARRPGGEGCRRRRRGEADHGPGGRQRAAEARGRTRTGEELGLDSTRRIECYAATNCRRDARRRWPDERTKESRHHEQCAFYA